MGGKIFKDTVPIKQRHMKLIYDINIKEVFKKYKLQNSPLGSFNKKYQEEYSGDIDVAIKLEFNDKNINYIKNILIKNILGVTDQDFKVSEAFKMLSWKTIFYDDNINKNYIQVDFIFTNNLEYTKFMYHSPNYRKNESSFKGLYRTNLLTYIAGRHPINHNPNFQDTYSIDKDGNQYLSDYWKYTLTYNRGLVITHKTYRGKKGPLKNPVTVKKNEIPVTEDINGIISFILGHDATIEDCNSFESLVDFLLSDKYKFKDNKEVIWNIFSDFFSDPRHEEKYLECMEYVYKKFDKDMNDILLKNLYSDINAK